MQLWRLAREWLVPVEQISARRFYLRLLWVSLQLVATYYFLSNDDPFFYQGF